MWIYVQSTGELIPPHGDVIQGCYAGFDAGRNNPRMQSVSNLRGVSWLQR